MLGAASSAQGAGDMCSDYPGGVIDGNVVNISQLPSTLGIDRDCIIKNFPQSVGGLPFTLVNFQFPQHASYLIIFDNVYYEGNMSCNDPTQSTFSMWWSNGSYNNISSSCQEFIIPVDGIHKENPAGQTTATIGVPFTYTLTFPDMATLTSSGYVYSGRPDTADVYNIQLTDDLSATGADLTYLSNSLFLKKSDGTTTSLGSLTNSGDSKRLSFSYADNPVLSTIPANAQVVLRLTVVLDDTATNVPGTQFVNTAHWELGRIINGTEYEPLPGQDGITQPMTIVGPNLVVNKTSSETALNLGVPATFTIDVQNTGGSDAWNATILDQLPDGTDGGMCDYDPTKTPGGVTAKVVAADGSPVSALKPGTDYSVTYSKAPTCRLSLSLLDTPAAKVGPSQHLLINYQSELDGDSKDGITLTNVAGATRWFSGNSSITGRQQYNRGPLTDGTPGVSDFQDSETVTTALSGYYFQKTVENLTTGANPATAAAPGDRLRYRVRLFNVDQTIDAITIGDLLDPSRFDLSTFALVTPPPAGAIYSFNAANGQLTISGNPSPLNVPVGGELVVEFEITLKSTLTNGTAVDNQATLSATGLTAESDDPYVNGIAPPGAPADPTEVIIQTPGPLAKVNTRASATIGEQFTYRITVPATPTAVPLYDVRILDDLGLSAAEHALCQCEGGLRRDLGPEQFRQLPPTSLSRTRPPASTSPPGGQAVIEVTAELQNTATNQRGLPFKNSASYTYNRINGDEATRTAGGAGTTPDMNVVEPAVTAAAKTVRFVTPAGKPATYPAARGDVLEYTLTIPNSGDSTAFDTDVVDTLPANLSLVAGSATARINGVDVAGFVPDPTPLPGGALAWGRRNGDDTLDIPPGQSLVLTYQATVVSITGTEIDNSAYVDWTSLDGASRGRAHRRRVPGRPLPPTAIAPVRLSPPSAPSTRPPSRNRLSRTPMPRRRPARRIRSSASGTRVTYDLTLNLQEYTTRNVVVEDALPEGMALESFTINGGSQLQLHPGGATGARRHRHPALGVRRYRQPAEQRRDADRPPGDPLCRQGRHRCAAGGGGLRPPHLRSTTRRSSPTRAATRRSIPERLTATERIDVRQPQMSAISKVDLGSGRVGTGTAADPYQVDISTDVMNFRLSSCNDGQAPAYGVVMTDLLAPELDESDLAANPPVVKIGTTTLTAGTDYAYTAPARGGEMRIALLDGAPVNPGPMRHGRLQPRFPYGPHNFEELEQPGPADRIPVAPSFRAGPPLRSHRAGRRCG